MAGEVQEPAKRGIPRAILLTFNVIAFLYLFATIGILLALSLTKLHLVEGLVETFKAIFGTSGLGNVTVYALGIAALYAYFADMTTWTMGANRSAVEAAAEGELPKVLGREHPTRHTPCRRALIGTGIISTLVLVVDGAVHQHPGLAVLRDLRGVLGDLPAALPADVPGGRDPPALQGPRDRAQALRRIPGGEPRRRGARGGASRASSSSPGSCCSCGPKSRRAPSKWSYTGPLLGIVVGTLLAGRADAVGA